MEHNGWNMNPDKLNAPYADQWEMMLDFMSLLDMRIYYLYKYHMWVGPENNLQNMMGLAVSRAEFEMNLTRAVDSVIGINLQNEEIADIQVINGYFSGRMVKTGVLHPDFPVFQVIKKFSLDEFAQNCLLLAFAVQLEKNTKKYLLFYKMILLKKRQQPKPRSSFLPFPGRKKPIIFAILLKIVC